MTGAKNPQKGFLLLEMLVAALLFSLFSAQISSGFIQTLKAYARLCQDFEQNDPLRIFFLRIEKDLRNSVSLKEYPFQGSAAEIKFPVRLEEKLFRVRYFQKDHSLIRSLQALRPGLNQSPPREAAVLKKVESVRFQFSYRDEKEKLIFEPFWIEEPYRGIPRAVKIQIQISKKTGEEGPFLKCISILQGHYGVLSTQA